MVLHRPLELAAPIGKGSGPSHSLTHHPCAGSDVICRFTLYDHE